MSSKVPRLFEILELLQEGDRNIYDFPFKVSESIKYSDACVLEDMGYITWDEGSGCDCQTVLHLVKMPTIEELDENYPLYRQTKRYLWEVERDQYNLGKSGKEVNRNGRKKRTENKQEEAKV